MTLDEYRKVLRRIIARDFDGVQRRAAEAWDVPEQNISNFLHGIRVPPMKVLAATGYKRVMHYEPLDGARKCA